MLEKGKLAFGMGKKKKENHGLIYVAVADRSLPALVS